MKVLVVGDIHGNFNRVLAEVEKRMNSFEHIVFLGDYVDSFDPNQNGYPMINGFNRMIEMDNGKFHILIGNHDLSYLSDDRVSGHRYDFAQQYREMFLNNLDKMDVCCQLGDYVFSHAGISKAWAMGIERPSGFFLEYARISKEDYKKMDLIDKINFVFHKKMFEFFDYDIADKSYVGDYPTQGPLWIRPVSLWGNMAFNKQVVGHTEIKKEDRPFIFKEKDIKENRKELIVLDGPDHYSFLELEA